MDLTGFQAALQSHQQGRLAEAELRYRDLLAMRPNWPDVLHMLGLICRENPARIAEAKALMAQAAAHGANSALFHANFASVHLCDHDATAALAAADRALAMQPTHFGALQNRALALTELRQDSIALAAVDLALSMRRQAPLLRARVRLLEHLHPEMHLENVQLLCQEFPEPLHFFWLGRAQLHAAKPLVAESSLRRALELAATSQQAAPGDTRLLLAIALADTARPLAAVAMYDDLLAQRPDYYQAASNRLIALQHVAATSASDLLIEHQRWAGTYANVVRRVLPRTDADHRPLRVAFLSPRLAEGPVATFLLPLLQALDISRVTAIMVDLSGVLDAHSDDFKACSAGWIAAAHLDDETLQQVMIDSAIDIAIDCAGHAPGNRLQAFAKGLAPLQIAWMDYFCTTGLPAMDALLSDTVLTPATDQAHFVEKLVTLPYGRLCYAPPANAPAPGAAREGRIRFGNFNRLAKFTSDAARVWCALLTALPDSELELRSSALDDPETAEHCYQTFFAPFGVAKSRITMKGRTSYLETLRAYQDIDIALDTYPFSGCATSCDALWMGVPVMTRTGTTMVSRQTASVLAQLQMLDCVSDTETQWISRTLALANDRQKLHERRRNLREAMRQRVCHVKHHADAFASALEKLWDDSEKSMTGNQPPM